MFVASGREIDPTLFQRDYEQQFSSVVVESATTMEEANAVIHLREGYDPEAEAEGIAREIEDEGGELQEKYEDLIDMLGGDADFLNRHIISPIMGGGKSEVSDEDYEQALTRRGEAAITLVDYTCGYQVYMKENLVRAYGHDDETVEEEAWAATWKKMRDILSSAEGTLLAEVALFMDGLVKEKFGRQYRPMEMDRGPAVSQDVSARTFYVVMEKHLHRAILGANRDEWTGYQ